MRKRLGSRIDAMQLAGTNPRLQAAVQRSRELVRRRAATAAVAGAIPVPGLDMGIDAALLAQLLPAINREFGLAPEQISRLDAPSKEEITRTATLVGSIVIGRVVTQGLVLRFASLVGLRLSAAQIAKFVPIAGQVASGVLGYSIIHHLAERHIRDCVQVARALPALPPPPAPPA